MAESSLFENYSSNGYNDLLTALRLADERITSKILKIPDDTWTKQKLNEIKRFIESEIQASYGGLFEAMQNESVQTAEIVMAANIGDIKARLPKSTIADLVNSNREIRMSEDAVYGFKELYKITADNHARQLRVVVASGVSNGLTAQQIVREYGIKSTALSKGQIVGNIQTTIGLSRDEGRYVSFKKLEERGVITGYIYDATLDSGTTIYCREHDQRVYRKTIEEIQHLIKVHARCRSLFRPTQKTSTSDTRPSQFGEVKNEPYSKWYAKQSNSFKQSTLTNRRYNAYLKGNYKVKGLADLDKKVPIATIEKELFKLI
jgi:hypothetical protein